MSEKPDNLANLHKKMRLLQREHATLKRQYAQICQSLGIDELRGWTPDPTVEKMYGWVHAWLYPLSHLPYASPNLRNQVYDTTRAIILQLVLLGKYGIHAPLEERPVDSVQFVARQNKSSERKYPPCVVCGEMRITHECHIIPAADAGPYHRDNLVILCPLHHHLFDHHRLTQAEWSIIQSHMHDKMESAHLYAEHVRLPKLQRWWSENE